jgi:cell division protease FtsH
VVEAQERARDTIRRHREKLDALAARLLSVEVVEEEEMSRLWGPKVERPGGFMGRGHTEAPPEDPNHPHGEAERHWPVTQAAVGTAKPPGAGE